MKKPFDQLLRDALTSPAPAADDARCLDAERLAAWFDGTLDDRPAAEAHVADCVRCQALLAAMVRTAPPEPPRAWWRTPAVGWLVPLTVAAAGIFAWVNVQPRETAPPAAQMMSAPPAGNAAAPAPTATDARLADSAASEEALSASARKAADEARALLRSKGEATDSRQRLQAAFVPPPPQIEPLRDSVGVAIETPRVPAPAGASPVLSRAAAAPVAPLPASADAQRGRGEPAAEAPAPPSAPPHTLAETVVATQSGAVAGRRDFRSMPRELVVQSPDASVRWRVTGPRAVQKTTDGGARWITQPTDAAVVLTAGSSPSSSVCWLAGPGGTVLISTDGQSWQRLAFPERVDLISIVATDDRTATVTAADGRRFSTGDRGKSWSR